MLPLHKWAHGRCCRLLNKTSGFCPISGSATLLQGAYKQDTQPSMQISACHLMHLRSWCCQAPWICILTLWKHQLQSWWCTSATILWHWSCYPKAILQGNYHSMLTKEIERCPHRDMFELHCTYRSMEPIKHARPQAAYHPDVDICLDQHQMLYIHSPELGHRVKH